MIGEKCFSTTVNVPFATKTTEKNNSKRFERFSLVLFEPNINEEPSIEKKILVTQLKPQKEYGVPSFSRLPKN